HHRAIGAEDVLQEVLAVAGEGEGGHLGLPRRVPDLPEERLGVLDGVALAERVARVEDLAVGAQADGLRRGRSEVAADDDRIRAHAPRRRGARRELAPGALALPPLLPQALPSPLRPPPCLAFL